MFLQFHYGRSAQNRSNSKSIIVRPKVSRRVTCGRRALLADHGDDSHAVVVCAPRSSRLATKSSHGKGPKGSACSGRKLAKAPSKGKQRNGCWRLKKYGNSSRRALRLQPARRLGGCQPGSQDRRRRAPSWFLAVCRAQQCVRI